LSSHQNAKTKTTNLSKETIKIFKQKYTKKKSVFIRYDITVEHFSFDDAF